MENKAQSVTAKAQKILLPMIQHLTPTLLAHSIVGVQPMTGSVGKIFTMRHSYTPQPKYKFSRAKWYVADLWNSGHDMDEVREWCTKHFGPQPLYPDAWSRWINHLNSTFRFSNEKDYNWFVLRWGA